jgi:hypothetical protein
MLGINSAKSNDLDSAKINIVRTLAKADTNVYKVVIVDGRVYVLNKQYDVVNQSSLQSEEMPISYIFFYIIIVCVMFILIFKF